MNDKKSNLFNILALLIMLVVLIGGMLFVKPLWDEVGSIEKGNAEKVTEKENLDKKLVELKSLEEELNAASEVTRQTTLAAVPEKLNEDKLIEDISGIAIKNDMTLNGVSFSIPSTSLQGEVAKVGINANLTGDDNKLIGFLKDVEGNSRKLVVKNITIQLGENEQGDARVSFNLNMEAYFQGVI